MKFQLFFFFFCPEYSRKPWGQVVLHRLGGMGRRDTQPALMPHLSYLVHVLAASLPRKPVGHSSTTTLPGRWSPRPWAPSLAHCSLWSTASHRKPSRCLSSWSSGEWEPPGPLRVFPTEAHGFLATGRWELTCCTHMSLSLSEPHFPISKTGPMIVILSEDHWAGSVRPCIKGTLPSAWLIKTQ